MNDILLSIYAELFQNGIMEGILFILCSILIILGSATLMAWAVPEKEEIINIKNTKGA